MRRTYHQPTNSEVATTPQFATEYVLAPADDDCCCFYIRPANTVVTTTNYLTENDNDILTTNAGGKLTWE